MGEGTTAGGAREFGVSPGFVYLEFTHFLSVKVRLTPRNKG